MNLYQRVYESDGFWWIWKGIFFTPISPTSIDNEIHIDLFNSSQNHWEKNECCFAFKIQDIPNLIYRSYIDRLSWKRQVLKSTENIEYIKLNEIKFFLILRPCSNWRPDDFLFNLLLDNLFLFYFKILKK